MTLPRIRFASTIAQLFRTITKCLSNLVVIHVKIKFTLWQMLEKLSFANQAKVQQQMKVNELADPKFY